MDFKVPIHPTRSWSGLRFGESFDILKLSYLDSRQPDSLHFKTSRNSACGIGRDPYVVSSGWNNPVHIGIVRAEIVSIDGELNCLVCSGCQCNALKAFQLAHRA